MTKNKAKKPWKEDNTREFQRQRNQAVKFNKKAEKYFLKYLISADKLASKNCWKLQNLFFTKKLRNTTKKLH